MAHFAELDEYNNVIQVIVVGNEYLLDENGEESEQKGIDFLVQLYSHSRWKQASYNHNMRGRYPAIGMIYDPDLDVFRDKEKPLGHPSYILSENGTWIPPIPYPEDGVVDYENPDNNRIYLWDEENLSWNLIPYQDALEKVMSEMPWL